MANYKKLMAASAGLLFSLGAFAEDADTDDVIVVTAAKIEQSESSSVEKVQVITEEQILSSGSHTLNELFNSIPGVSYTGRSIGSAEPLQMNGFTDEYVKILIDGIAIENGGSTNILEHIQIENIDHIEVLNGSASALYGSDAIAGVINIITKKNKDKPITFRVSQEADSNKQFLGNAVVGFKNENFRLEASGGYDYQAAKLSDEYQPSGTTRSGRTTTKTPAINYKEYEQAEKLSYNGSALLGYDFDENRSVSVQGSYLHSEETRSSTGTYTDSNYDRINGTGNFNWALTDTQGISGFFSYRQYAPDSDTTTFTSMVSDTDATIAHYEYTDGETSYFRDYEAEARYTNDLNDWNQVLLGLNAIYSTSDKGDEKHKSFLPSLFAQDIMTLGRLQLTPGARVTFSVPIDDADSDHLMPTLLADGTVDWHKPESSEKQELEIVATPKLAARYELTDDFILRASVGTGYKTPTLTQKYNTAYKGYGNPNLKSEKSVSGSLGFDWKLPVEGLSLSVNGQTTYLRDAIATKEYGRISNSSTTGYRLYENLGKALSIGGTAQIAYKTESWNASLSYTYLRYRATKDDNDEWTEISGKIPHAVNASVTYTVPLTKTSVNLNGVWYAPTLTSDDGDEYGPDYLVVNARIDHPIDEKFTVFGGAKNIFNSHSFIKGDDDSNMEDKYGSGLSDRIFYIGAKYNY